MKSVIAYLLARASEKSTWQGLAVLVAVVAWKADPAGVKAYVAEGAAALAVLHVAFPQDGVITWLQAKAQALAAATTGAPNVAG